MGPAYRPLPFSGISENSHLKWAFWQQFKFTPPPSLHVIKSINVLWHTHTHIYAVPPTNTKFKPLLLLTQAGMLYTNTHKHRRLYLKSTHTFLGPAKHWKSNFAARQKPEILHFFISRESSSTLYVTCGSTTNTKIKALTSPNSSGYGIQQIFTSTEHHISSLHSHSKRWKSISAVRQKLKILAFLHHQRER